jgi:hypothetical protein
MIKLSDLKKNPNNPRLIKDDKFQKLVKSIENFPKMMELRPIIVNDQNIVLGGNMRLAALKELGYKEIPNEWVKKAKDLTPEQQNEFIVKDNVSFGAWDWDILANEWDSEQLVDWGLDVPNFEVDELLEAEEDDFEIPEITHPITVLGDLYEIGQHRLLCGDSTDSDQVAKLMNGEKADIAFTDPPYGIDYSGGRTQVVETKNYGKLMNDDLQGVELGDLISNVFLFNKQEADVYICVSPKMQKPFLDFIENSNKTIDAVIVQQW